MEYQEILDSIANAKELDQNGEDGQLYLAKKFSNFDLVSAFTLSPNDITPDTLVYLREVRDLKTKLGA